MEFRASLSRFHALRENALRAWICRWNKMFHGHLHNFFHRNFRHPCAYSCCLDQQKTHCTLSLAFVQCREQKKRFSSWVSLFLLHNQQPPTGSWIIWNVKSNVNTQVHSRLNTLNLNRSLYAKELSNLGSRTGCLLSSIDRQISAFINSLLMRNESNVRKLSNIRCLSLSDSSYETFICQYLHNWSLKHAPLCLCWTIWQSLFESVCFAVVLSECRFRRAARNFGLSKLIPLIPI